MTIKRTLIVIILFTLAGLAISMWAYPRLPEMTPSHWNTAGEVDNTMPRAIIALLLPGLLLVIGLLLLYIPTIDPLRANVKRFRGAYNWFIAGMSLFLLFIHGLTILAGLGVSFNMTYLIIPATSLVIFGIGFVLDRTKQNWFMGIRTPWTLSSPTVWEKTHRLGGRLFKLSGVGILVGLFLPPNAAFLLLMGLIILPSLVSVFYSYFAYRAEKAQ